MFGIIKKLTGDIGGDLVLINGAAEPDISRSPTLTERRWRTACLLADAVANGNERNSMVIADAFGATATRMWSSTTVSERKNTVKHCNTLYYKYKFDNNQVGQLLFIAQMLSHATIEDNGWINDEYTKSLSSAMADAYREIMKLDDFDRCANKYLDRL